MRVGILGAGAYAMAISSILDNNNHELTMWTEFLDEAEILQNTRKNNKKMPGFSLSEKIDITTNIEEAVLDKDLIILAIPTQFLDAVCKKMQPYINNNKILIASKGIDQKTGFLVDKIISSNLNTQNIAILSGPTFAIDIPKKNQIGLSIASSNKETKDLIKEIFKNEYVNLDYTDDIIGTELCGAIKNIYAIVMGLLEGLECNESTKAFFMTEIIKETKELINFFGGQTETILTYASIGDIFLTCNSKNSRNYSFGTLLSNNKNESEINKYIEGTTVEGLYTLRSLEKILKEKNANFKIIDAIYKIIENKQEPIEILKIFK